MAFDPWPTVTGMLGSVGGWLGLRYFKKIELMEKRLRELEAAFLLQGEAHDRFVDGPVKDLRRIVRALHAKAYPHAVNPISDD